MVLSAIMQISTVIVAVLTLVWHQTRTVERLRKEVRADHSHLLKLHRKATRQARKDNDQLRTEFTSSHDKLRTEFAESHDQLRTEFTSSHDKLWNAVTANSRKLDRIEGFLGIGMPSPSADRAPGAALRHSPPADSAPPDPTDGPGPHEPESRAEDGTEG